MTDSAASSGQPERTVNLEFARGSIGTTQPNMNPNSARKYLSVITAAALIGAAAATSGCVVVAAGAGAGAAVAFVRGKLDANVGASFDATVNATNRAIQQLGFAKVSESRDALKDVFIVRNAADKKITIELGNLANNLTKVEIRVGVFGDEPLSIAILEKIKANL